MSKKKIIVMILFIGILASFVVWDNVRKSSGFIIHCDESIYNESGKLEDIIQFSKESIPCSNNKDCSVENMEKYCNPGFPILLRCSKARYYCGSNGKCMEYSIFDF